MQNILNLCILVCSLTIPKYAKDIHVAQDDQAAIYKALIFQIETQELIGARQLDQIAAHYWRWAAACPANSPAELVFEQNVSLDKKILFVRNITEQVLASELCGKPVQISAAYNSDKKQLQFGYEIYHDEKFQGFRSPSYTSMQSIKHFLSFFSTIKTIILQLSQENLALINDNDEKTKVGFVWIDRLSLQHDFKYWTPNVIRYQMLRNFPSTLRECNDYHLAENYFESADFDSFYTKENEQKILKDVDTLSFIIKCEPEVEKCLTKWQLIPANQISYNADAPSTCSNLTTVPVWTNLTRRLLENLTIFLQATIRKLKDNLNIVIQTGDPLLLPRTDGKPPQPIYMSSEANKIPIISVIYYFIRYTAPYCAQKNPSCQHAIVVVIHNDPNFDENKRICPQQEDLCMKLGWNWIRDEALEPEKSTKYANFYCCEPVDALISKFKLLGEKNVELEALDLGEVSVYNKKGEKSVKNLIGPILDTIKKMKEEKKENGDQGDLNSRSSIEESEESQSNENEGCTLELFSKFMIF